MKRSTTRILTATAIGAVGLVGLAAVGIADSDGHGFGYWGKHGGGQQMGGHGMGGHGMGGFGMGGPGRMHDMMLGFDGNNDGKLTQQEIDEGRTGQLKKFDKNGDGALTIAEYEALWLDAMRERMVDQFQEHDADGDGKVTIQEFGKRFANMVKYMDSNGDGVLDEQDMRQRHRRGEGRGMMQDEN